MGFKRLVFKMGNFDISPVVQFVSRGAIGVVCDPNLDARISKAGGDWKWSVKTRAKGRHLATPGVNVGDFCHVPGLMHSGLVVVVRGLYRRPSRLGPEVVQ